MSIKIKKSDIEKVMLCLLAKFEELNIDEVTLNMDEYWYIPTDDWSNADQQKTVLGLLSDDWGNLLRIINNKQIVTFLDFERFASILRAISETIVPTQGA